MKLFIDIFMKGIYLFNIVAWNYRKKIGFPVCKKENFAGLQAHRKRGKSARASPTPHHTLNEERSARFITQPLSALPENGEKTTVGLISKKATLHLKHTFLYISLPLFCTTKTWNFQKLFYGENVVRVLVHFFFDYRSFSPCICTKVSFQFHS